MGGRRPSAFGGFHVHRVRARLVDRGSPKRVRRIKWRDHTPPGFLALVALTIALVLALIWWLIIHPEWIEDHMHEIG
jgi:type II secretory pathway component PulM